MPKEAVIAVTYRCNARCNMCNIWKDPGKDELEPSHYSKLPPSLRTINITGGEPFLRHDLVEIVMMIHKKLPNARLVFSTNGSMSDTVTSIVSEVLRFHRRVGVGVSIDGTRETHDRIRGVPIYDRAISTVKQLKEIGLRDLRIGMTLSAENVEEAGKVFDLSRELGVEFTTTFAHNSEIYFRKMDNTSLDPARENLMSVYSVMRSQLRSSSPKNWFRAYHTSGIVDSALRHKFVSRCEAGRRYFFMSPGGDVFPCMVMNMQVGNIRGVERWDQLFSPEIEDRVQKAVRKCKEDCWMVCNTRSLFLRHPLRAGAWVVKNKARAHVSRSLSMPNR